MKTKTKTKILGWLSVVIYLMPVTVFAATSVIFNNQLIIKYKAVTTIATGEKTVRPQAVTKNYKAPNGERMLFKRSLSDDSVVVKLSDSLTEEQVQEVLDSLVQDAAVEYAQIDKRMYPAFTPSDSEFSRQWYLFDTQPTGIGINMPDAWDITTGDPSVVIAVLDTGVLDHRDLDTTPVTGRILSGYDFITDTFTANDGDGRDIDSSDPGDAVLAGGCGTNDPLMDELSSWHGLSVLGVIAATSNTIDVTGIDFAARILPIRVLGKCGGAVSDIVEAMRWAVGQSVAGIPDNTNPAKVINLSLSGDGTCSPAEQAAIDIANAAGAVVVVAAGNEGQDITSKSPANCRGVVVAGATARNGDRTSYVNFGSAVDLSAPGGDGADGVLTLSNFGADAPAGDALATIQGTSFTAAQISSVAALVFDVDNTLSSEAVRGVLCSSAQPFPAGSTCDTATCGTGILDANAALIMAQNPPATVPACANNDVTPASNGGGGGGGGCILSNTNPFDPIWLLFMLAGVFLKRVRL